MTPDAAVTHGVTYTRWQILLYTVLLVLATICRGPPAYERAVLPGRGAGARMCVLWYPWRSLRSADEFFAMRTFQYSIVYLMALSHS